MQAGIFEIFAQVEDHLTKALGGLGIGLALVRQLVAQHGGTIKVESAGQDKGGMFSVRVPLAADGSHETSLFPDCVVDDRPVEEEKPEGANAPYNRNPEEIPRSMAVKSPAPSTPAAPAAPVHRPAVTDGRLGLDGLAVEKLLRGALLKGLDPKEVLREARIDPSVYGDEHAVIDGSALFRLVEHIQQRLDDAYIGFLAERCRLALETERTRAYLHSGTFGEALRISIRFTQALSSDIGPQLVETEHHGVMHVCAYNTVDGVDRDIFVWLRFVWIYHLFSWLIGRPLKLRRVLVQGRRPLQANGFDRFALFQCPIEFGAPVDALCYDRNDLNVRLVHGTLAEYEEHNAGAPDWFAPPGGELSWRGRTEQALVEFQREGVWLPTIEAVAERLRSQPRRLRRNLAREGESFQQIRTRLRGEVAGALLLATDLPVTNVGYAVGFSEPGSFTRNFSDWATMTPSEYRHRYKSDAARMAAATTLVAERR